MKKLLVWMLTLCSLELIDGSAVIHLEEEEIDGFLKKKPVVMCVTYKQPCSECNKVLREFEKAAKLAQTQKKPYAFIQVDLQENPQAAKRLGTTGNPGTRLFVNGYGIDVETNMTADAIISFIHQQSIPRSTFLRSTHALRNIEHAPGLRVSDYRTP